MTLPAILAALLSAATITASDSTPKFVAPRTIAELEARIRRVADSAKVPGVGLAIVRHDSVIYTGGIGRARVSPAAAATDSTLFRIGSTSKAFVALTAQALVREGKLDLSTPLATALPGFYFRNQWEATDPVRIVNLLEHTSGFDDNSLKSYANNDPSPLTLANGLALDSATRVSRWRPGTRFSYCNTGPAIVALIIEKIEGKPFEQVVQERWFTPIGMRTATYFRPDSTKLPVATLYRGDGTTPVRYWNVFIRPAGSINANAHDMAAYVRFLLGRGTIDGKALLPAESIERMERSESSMMSRAGLRVGYGLHLYRVADSLGFTWTEHNGGVEGGLSDMSYLPAYGVGYAFQINSGNGDAFAMITRLVRAYLTQGLTPPATVPGAKLSAATVARFAGWYRSVSPRTQALYPLERVFALTHASFDDLTLHLEPPFGDVTVFVPVDSVRFRAMGQSEPTLAFVRDDANGRPEGIESFGNRLGVSMARVPAIDAVGTLGVACLFIAGCLLSLTAMAFGALRWTVRRVRGRTHPAAPAASAWRVAALAALCMVVHVVMLAIGSGDVEALGTLSKVSGTMWLTGILFCIATLVLALLAWNTQAEGRWQGVSRFTVRSVAVLNLAATTYLLMWGWIGWKPWV